MSVDWDDYLNTPAGSYCECHRQCQDCFQHELKNLQRIIQHRKPQVVACLGAGVLNDIPYRTLVLSGATVHLVDWLPGSLESGIDQSIMTSDEAGKPQCVYCDQQVSCPEAYCAGYRKAKTLPAPVCDAFVPLPGNPLRCAAFRSSERPTLHCEDVTSGYGSAFARGVLDQLRGVRSWRQAFGRGKALAERVRGRHTPLNIPAGSAQLVTSSLLLSQFEHEPYDYFSRRAADLLGPPKEAEEKSLSPMMDKLRTTLLLNQVEGHCEAIKRILHPEGLCYMSFEMFHYGTPNGRWFLINAMHRAMEVVGNHFHFNFNLLEDRDLATRFEVGGTPSIVFHFILEQKEA